MYNVIKLHFFRTFLCIIVIHAVIHVNLHVPLQSITPRKRHLTNEANKRPTATVGPEVIIQLRRGPEPTWTLTTRVWPIPRVRLQVQLQVPRLDKPFLTNVATKWFFVCVRFNMDAQTVWGGKRPTADVADISTLSGMDSHVSLKIALLRETALTDLTAVGTNLTMGSHVTTHLV